MLDLLTAPETIAFSAALLLMMAIGLIEALGLGASGIDLDIDSGVLDWLGFGRVPLLVLLVAFLASFGILGLVGQQTAFSLTGALVSPLIAIPAALASALPLTALLARGLARIMPQDETTALDLDDLVGLPGTITVGRASANSPARTRVVDPHGQAHHVLVEPHDPAATFEEGDSVVLVRREGQGFRAVLRDPPYFSNWITS